MLEAHLLRSVNQDECRLEIWSSLSASFILLVLDWEMFFIALAIKGNSGVMEMMTFIHVFESTTAQDSSSVLAILSDVFSQLKTIMPQLQTIYIRNDNAGCYHCVQTLIIAPKIAKRHGLQIKRSLRD